MKTLKARSRRGHLKLYKDEEASPPKYWLERDGEEIDHGRLDDPFAVNRLDTVDLKWCDEEGNLTPHESLRKPKQTD